MNLIKYNYPKKKLTRLFSEQPTFNLKSLLTEFKLKTIVVSKRQMRYNNLIKFEEYTSIWLCDKHNLKSIYTLLKIVFQ